MSPVTGRTALADALEERLGDPYDVSNPYGFGAILAAREAGQPLDVPTLDPEAARPAVNGGPEARLHALRALYRRSPGIVRTPHVTHSSAHQVAHSEDEFIRIGAAVGTLDSALRITLRHLRGRRLYGAAAADIPYLGDVLCGVLADLLLCDVLTTLAVRGVDALPSRHGAHAQAVRSLVPRVLQGAMDRLSVVMGSRFYIREGEHAVFQLLLNETQRELFAPGRAMRSASPSVPLAELIAAPPVVALCATETLAAAPGSFLVTATRRAPQPSGPLRERLHAELSRRYDSAHSFDLAERRLPDRP